MSIKKERDVDVVHVENGTVTIEMWKCPQCYFCCLELPDLRDHLTKKKLTKKEINYLLIKAKRVLVHAE